MKKLTFAFFPLFLAAFVLPVHHYSGDAVITIPEEQVDGPYVLYKNDLVFVKYIFQNDQVKTIKEDSAGLSQKKSLVLNVSTDIPGKTFTVKLKEQLQNEKPETANAGKLLALSDIEGNFAAFRELLQANGVMDENFDWTFGNGQLVLIGDFFDRGYQVTEVLWLIYSLEEKAKAAGGYVHFILGNHEIMNLSGDLRYVQHKYLETASLLKEKYEDLYGENSELGRWLRTKNIIEKIGDLLFIHGGFSSEMNNLGLSIARINDLARPSYAQDVYKYRDKKLSIIYDGKVSPFWYRGYYWGNDRASQQQVDSTLSEFGNKYIITGHTIVADTISVWLEGKVFNTDVHHAAGKSEALLVEDGKFFRVNTLGQRFLLKDRMNN